MLIAEPAAGHSSFVVARFESVVRACACSCGIPGVSMALDVFSSFETPPNSEGQSGRRLISNVGAPWLADSTNLYGIGLARTRKVQAVKAFPSLPIPAPPPVPVT